MNCLKTESFKTKSNKNVPDKTKSCKTESCKIEVDMTESGKNQSGKAESGETETRTTESGKTESKKIRKKTRKSNFGLTIQSLRHRCWDSEVGSQKGMNVQNFGRVCRIIQAGKSLIHLSCKHLGWKYLYNGPI